MHAPAPDLAERVARIEERMATRDELAELRAAVGTVGPGSTRLGQLGGAVPRDRRRDDRRAAGPSRPDGSTSTSRAPHIAGAFGAAKE